MVRDCRHFFEDSGLRKKERETHTHSNFMLSSQAGAVKTWKKGRKGRREERGRREEEGRMKR